MFDKPRWGIWLGSAVIALTVVIILFFRFLPISFASVPALKTRTQLNLNDRLVVKSQSCALQIQSQKNFKIVIVCIANNSASSVQAEQTKSIVTLQSGDKLVVKTNACNLNTTFASTTRIVI